MANRHPGTRTLLLYDVSSSNLKGKRQDNRGLLIARSGIRCHW